MVTWLSSPAKSPWRLNIAAKAAAATIATSLFGSSEGIDGKWRLTRLHLLWNEARCVVSKHPSRRRSNVQRPRTSTESTGLPSRGLDCYLIADLNSRFHKTLGYQLKNSTISVGATYLRITRDWQCTVMQHAMGTP